MKRLLSLLAPLLIAALLACAGEPEKGPRDVKWDSEACTRCSMLIGSKADAVQVRDTGGKLHAFDDLGCALLWLDDHPTHQPAKEVWVRDVAGENWQSGFGARYETGRHTPMGYGMGVAEGGEDAFGLEQAREHARKVEGERRSVRP